MLDARLYQQPVDHHLNRVVLALVEIEVVIQIHDLSVDARPRVAMLEQRLHLFLEFAFSAPHDWSQNHDAIFRRERHHALHNLLGGLPAYRTATLGTMRNSDGGEQQAKIIVDLSDGSDGR